MLIDRAVRLFRQFNAGPTAARLSGLACSKIIQIANCKQTADLFRNPKLSCPTTLHCISYALSQRISKSKLTTESKQLTLSKFQNFHTQQLFIVSM